MCYTIATMQRPDNDPLPRLRAAVYETRTLEDGLKLDCILDALASQALGRSELLLESVMPHEESPDERALSEQGSFPC